MKVAFIHFNNDTITAKDKVIRSFCPSQGLRHNVVANLFVTSPRPFGDPELRDDRGRFIVIAPSLERSQKLSEV